MHVRSKFSREKIRQEKFSRENRKRESFCDLIAVFFFFFILNFHTVVARSFMAKCQIAISSPNCNHCISTRPMLLPASLLVVVYVPHRYCLKVSARSCPVSVTATGIICRSVGTDAAFVETFFLFQSVCWRARLTFRFIAAQNARDRSIKLTINNFEWLARQKQNLGRQRTASQLSCVSVLCMGCPSTTSCMRLKRLSSIQVRTPSVLAHSITAICNSGRDRDFAVAYPIVNSTLADWFSFRN